MKRAVVDSGLIGLLVPEDPCHGEARELFEGAEQPGPAARLLKGLPAQIPRECQIRIACGESGHDNISVGLDHDHAGREVIDQRPPVAEAKIQVPIRSESRQPVHRFGAGGEQGGLASHNNDPAIALERDPTHHGFDAASPGPS